MPEIAMMLVRNIIDDEKRMTKTKRRGVESA